MCLLRHSVFLQTDTLHTVQTKRVRLVPICTFEEEDPVNPEGKFVEISVNAGRFFGLPGPVVYGPQTTQRRRRPWLTNL